MRWWTTEPRGRLLFVVALLLALSPAVVSASPPRAFVKQDVANATAAPNATLAPNATGVNQTRHNRTRTASQSVSQSGSMSTTQTASTSTSTSFSPSVTKQHIRKVRTRTASATIQHIPPTPVPSLNGDDLLRSYDYYVSLILDVSSLTFSPDGFAAVYLAPALADLTFVDRTVILDWCGINLAPLATGWESTWCGGDVTTQYPNTVVRYTFARAVGPSNYTAPNVVIGRIPSLHQEGGSSAAFYKVVLNPPPVFTSAPGVFERAASSATSPGGIVIIVFILLMLVVLVIYVVRKVFLKPRDKGSRGAAYSVGAEPPQPGRAEFEMARPASSGPGVVSPPYDDLSKPSSRDNYGQPTNSASYGYSNPSGASGYGRGSSPRESSPPPADPSPSSHAAREMDVAY